jgi:hypothetical protein
LTQKSTHALNVNGPYHELTKKPSSINVFEGTETKSDPKEMSIIKQPSLSTKPMDNFLFIENEVVIGKVRVMKPKLFELRKQAFLPTIYSIAEVKRPVGGAGKRKRSSFRNHRQAEKC